MLYLFRSNFLVFTFLLTLVGSISAQPGSFDPSFGPNGIVLTATEGHTPDAGNAVAVQPDGKIIVVGGRSPFSGTGSAVITRHNPDGSIDSSFGTRGAQQISFFNSRTVFYDVAIQPDGKIVAVGGYANTTQGTALDMLVMRFNANGTFDSSFNFNGWVFTDFNVSSDEAFAVAIQPDGRIVVGGYSSISWKDYAFVRYNTDGSLDTTFGTGGRVLQSGNTFSGDDIVYDLAIQADGKVVGAGVTNSSGVGSDCFGLIRLNSNGTLDAGFGSAGLVKTLFEGGNTSARGISIYPDGRIAAGGTRTATSDIFVVARYLTDGGLDTSFDGDGRVITPVATQALGVETALQPDEKLILAGFSPQQNRPVFARYNLDGTLDGSFGTDGIASHGFGGFDDKVLGIALLPNGKILATGVSGQSGSSERDIVLVRYLADGSIDRSFGSPGRVHTSISNGTDTAYDVLVQPDGKIVAAGTSRGPTAGGSDVSVVRYLPSGAIDPLFGKVVIPIGSTIDTDFARVSILPDGKLVVAGFGRVSDQFRIVIARLNSDGTPDTTFGPSGRRILGPGTIGENMFINDLLVQPDGKILLGCLGGNPFDYVLIRLNTNGTPDTTFDMDGKATLSLSAGSDRLASIALQSDGKILAVGGVEITFANNRIGLARFNSDGSPDTTFAPGGFVVPSLNNLSLTPHAMALESDGQIVVGASNGSNFAVARFNPNSTLDTSFDGDGLALVPIAPGSNSEVKDLAIQRNGRIVVAGLYAVSSEFDFVAARLNSDGSLDTTFSGDGIFDPELGNMGESLNAVALQRDGKIVAAGGINEFARRTFAVLRLTGDGVPGTAFDFDGDGKTDLGIFRPSVGEWWINRSGNDSTVAFQFGTSTDRVVPADYTGDGKTDVAVWRPSNGEWFVLRSEDFSFYSAPFGANGDMPSPADYDADGKADLAVFRPSSATWFIQRSGDNGTTIQQFGADGDQPVAADYDGDGKADIAIYRPSIGEWWLNRSTAGVIAYGFGNSTDKAVPGDYTGDGKSDVAFWRPSTGEWYVLRSEDTSFYSAPFGTNGDIPAPGDYDGDGKFDLTVFRPSSGTWFSQRTTAGTLIQQFGADGDRPIPNAFIP